MQREIEDTVLEHFSDDNVTHIKRLVYFFASTKAKQEANADYLRLFVSHYNVRRLSIT